MARYIDADALIEALQTDFDREGAKAYEYAMQEGMEAVSIKYSHGQFCFLNAIERVKDTPTADVISKEFLTRKEDEAYERGYAEAKSEVDEIIGAFDVWLYKHYNGDISDWDLYKLFAELKKKYAEEKDD